MSRILVVDDDVNVLRSFREIYREQAIDVDLATDLASAVDTARNRPPDVAILDVCLTTCTGWQVLESLRQYYPGLPVILISGSADADEMSERSDKYGAATFLRKPLNLCQLDDTVQKALSSTLI